MHTPEDLWQAAAHGAAPVDAPAAGRAEDAALVARALGGEARAFEAIMRRYNRLLFRAARGVVHDDAEAQDVVQETYLRAFTRLRDFRGEAALGTWLARICVRAAQDVLRRRTRSVAVDATQAPDQEPQPEHAMPYFAPSDDSPDQALARAQLRALLESAVQSLPPPYRSVFILRAVQEMSVQETALCLDISEELVRTRYLRSRAMLRDALGARIEACAESAFPFAGARCDQVVHQVLAELRRRGLLA